MDGLTVFLELLRNLFDGISPQARIVVVFTSGLELDIVVVGEGVAIELVEFVLERDQLVLKIEEKAVVKPAEFAIDQEARISIGEGCNLGVADDVMVHWEDKDQDSI